MSGIGPIMPGPDYLNFRRAALSLSGIAGLWMGGDRAGTVDTDELGANPGAYAASPTLGVPGLLNTSNETAVTYNGTTQYSAVPGASAINLADVWTVFAWFVHTSGGAERTLFGKVANYELLLTAGNYLALNKQGVAQLCTSAAPLVVGTHFAIGTKNAATIHLYLDGVDVTTSVANATCASANTILFTAQMPSNTFPFAGIIGARGVLNRDATPAECAYLWHAGSGK